MTFATMSKEELRNAMRAAGLSYSKMTNDDMRVALTANARKLADEKNDAELMERCGHVCCPSCGVHLSNGLLSCEDESMRRMGGLSISSGRTLRDTGEMTKEWECMGCGHQFGADVQPTKRTAPAPDGHTGTGLKIEKNREERNGVKRPSAGGKCRAIWDTLDAYVADPDNEGQQPTSKIVKAIAEEEGWNPTNAMIEFYNWRKFNGVTGR